MWVRKPQFTYLLDHITNIVRQKVMSIHLLVMHNAEILHEVINKYKKIPGLPSLVQL